MSLYISMMLNNYKKTLGILLVAALALLIQIGSAQAERRLALIIGINNYEFLPKLEKAVGDAKAMGATLSELGFEVTQLTNTNRRELNIAIADFTSQVSRDDLVLVHFSGHGVEIDGDNYLLPADVPKPKSGRKDAVKYESIGFRRLMSQITDTGARTRIFCAGCLPGQSIRTVRRPINRLRARSHPCRSAGRHLHHVFGRIPPDRARSAGAG